LGGASRRRKGSSGDYEGKNLFFKERRRRNEVKGKKTIGIARYWISKGVLRGLLTRREIRKRESLHLVFL